LTSQTLDLIFSGLKVDSWRVSRHGSDLLAETTANEQLRTNESLNFHKVAAVKMNYRLLLLETPQTPTFPHNVPMCYLSVAGKKKLQRMRDYQEYKSLQKYQVKSLLTTQS
jgi:hypothetical protein